MLLPRPMTWVTLILLLGAPPAAGQPGSARDSTLNNLVHAEGYSTSKPGTLGSVVEHGHGPIDMVLISGFGLGASTFQEFMRRNADRYRMFAVTLPGFEGTSAPPMPPPGTGYGAQTWTRCGHGCGPRPDPRETASPARGARALHQRHTDRHAPAPRSSRPVRAVVLLAGTPRFEPVKSSTFWPKDLTLEQKVRPPTDSARHAGSRRHSRHLGAWQLRRLRLFSRSRARETLRGPRQRAAVACARPLSLRIPRVRPLARAESAEAAAAPHSASFTDSVRADTTRNYLQAYFEEPWRGRVDGPHTESLFLKDAGILVMEDQPAIVDRKIAAFLKSLAD